MTVLSGGFAAQATTHKRWKPKRSVPVMLAFLACALALGTAPASAQQCTILDDCSGYTTLPTADLCEADDCTCAQQVECYLRNEDPTDNWPLLPGGELEINKNFFHDRFIETRISPQQLDDWIAAADPAVETVDLPNDTVIYKSGYLPKNKNIAKPDKPALSAYIMVKLDGYCPDGSSVGEFCLGGDWFSMEVAEGTYGILTEGSIVDQGKSTKCFSCHAAAEKGDWLWQLFSRRRYP